MGGESRQGVVVVGIEDWEKVEQLPPGIPVVLFGVGEELLMKPVSDELLAAVILRHGTGEPSESILVVGAEWSGLAATVGKMGWRTVGAAEGTEGLAKFGEERPGMVVVDLLMEGMDGFEFVRQLRQRADGREVPVVVMAAAGEGERLRELGAAAIEKGGFPLARAAEQAAMMANRRMG